MVKLIFQFSLLLLPSLQSGILAGWLISRVSGNKVLLCIMKQYYQVSSPLWLSQKLKDDYDE
jgi:hypothetical protein